MPFPGAGLRRSSLILLVAAVPLAAQQSPTAHYDTASYSQTSADIPMRDGVKLHVEIFRPKEPRVPLPILF